MNRSIFRLLKKLSTTALSQQLLLRLKLLMVAALVRVSVRRVVLSLSAAAPVREVFARIAQQLRTLPTLS